MNTTDILNKLTDAELGHLYRTGALNASVDRAPAQPGARTMVVQETTPEAAPKKGRVTKNSADARKRTAAAEAKAARPTPEFIVRRGANKALNRAAAAWARTPEGVKACEGLDWDGIKAAYQANA